MIQIGLDAQNTAEKEIGDSLLPDRIHRIFNSRDSIIPELCL